MKCSLFFLPSHIYIHFSSIYLSFLLCLYGVNPQKLMRRDTKNYKVVILFTCTLLDREG